jgi:hypothetical protein
MIGVVRMVGVVGMELVRVGRRGRGLGSRGLGRRRLGRRGLVLPAPR